LEYSIVDLQKEKICFHGVLFGCTTLLLTAITAYVANSIGMAANIVEIASETFSIFLAWVTVRKVEKGENYIYNYGYGKLESLANLSATIILTISVLFILYHSIDRFYYPCTINWPGTVIGLVVTVTDAALNYFLYSRLKSLEETAPSPLIKFQVDLFGESLAANLYLAFALTLSLLLLNYPWSAYIDPFISIILCCFNFHTIYGFISSSVYDLLDGTLEEDLQLVILRELAKHQQYYCNFNGIRSRRSGGLVYIDVFLEFEPELRMREVQNMIANMRYNLEKDIPTCQVTVMPTTKRIL